MIPMQIVSDAFLVDAGLRLMDAPEKMFVRRIEAGEFEVVTPKGTAYDVSTAATKDGALAAWCGCRKKAPCLHAAAALFVEVSLDAPEESPLLGAMVNYSIADN